MSTNGMMGASSMMMMGIGDMGLLGGQSSFVNDMGMIVGQAEMPGGNHHAVASGNGGMMGSVSVDLGTLGGSNSVAYCINNGGMVVGTAETTNGMPHAFMMTNVFAGMSQMMDLNDLVPTNSGWEMMEAHGVNAAGQIVGWGMHAGHTNAFLLTPVSGPTMMTSTPSSQVVGPGGAVSLHMEMSSNEPLQYQWLHDGVLMPGATNATLTLPDMGMLDSGRYTVTARNAAGTVANASAAVAMFSMNFSNGLVRLRLGAPVGSDFRIEYSDVMGSTVNWQPMTNFTMMSSTSEFSDPAGLTSHTRFYRAVMLP